MNKLLSPFRRKRSIFIFAALAVLLALGAWFRFQGLTANGFRNCDEGYYYYPGHLMELMDGPAKILYYYHGTIIWVRFGCSMLGFTPENALVWAALNGMACILLWFAFVRSIFPMKTALLAAFAVSTTYYFVYYSRINLSNIYGLFFMLAALYPLGKFSKLAERMLNEYREIIFSRSAFAMTGMSGLVAGFLFHVRVDSFVFLMAMFGALFVATLIRTERKTWLRGFGRFAVFGMAFLLAACISYSLFALIYHRWINWNSTIVWYGKQLPFIAGTARAWGLYLLEHIWKLCGIPFWTIAIIGFVAELRRWRELSLTRVWLLVCASGALAGFLYIGLPFPRGHVFLVLLMTLYWALGTLTLVRFFASKWRLAILAVLVFATFVGEFRIVSPMFTKRAKYNILPQVFTPASTVHNVNWPVMKSYFIEYIHTALELNIQNPLDRDELLEGILEKAPKCGYRYLILDYYTASSIKSELLERMALAIPPHAVLFNDYGEDYHTFMDARGYPPSHSMFSDKIVVWDLARIRQPVPEFPPYTTPEDMESRFLAWFSEAKRQQIRAATAATDSDEPASPSKETGTTPEAVPNIGKEPR